MTNFSKAGVAIIALMGLVGLYFFKSVADVAGSLFLIGAAYYFFRQHKPAKEVLPVNIKEVNIPILRQINDLKRKMLALAITIVFLTVVIVDKLNQLESGKVSNVTLWVPVSFLYNIGGYWFAVIGAPAILILLLLLVYRKMLLLKKEMEDNEMFDL